MKKSVSLAILIFSFALSVFGQTQPMGGVSTGEAKTYTSRRTVGVVDANAPKVFEDVTGNTVLKNYLQVGGDKSKNYIVETTSGSVAIFDYDNDGKPDIFLLNGGTIEALKNKGKMPRSALYRNLGNWKFEDVTDKAGVSNERWGMGLAVGDFDNDGFPDVFASNYGTARLYKNNGDGTFTDVAEKVGLNIKGWFTGATFGDYDKDGRLDLFVPAYVDFDLNKLPANPADFGKSGTAGSSFCLFRGQPVMCGPRGLKGAKDRLFHQQADGTFEDVSIKAKVTDEGDYYGFAAVFVDVDDDDDLDLLVVNDSTPKQLYINQGDGTFEEIGYASGIALNENGREQAGMGLAIGDFDNDGLVDFHITNFYDDSNTLYRNDGDANFTDITFQAGIGEPTIPFLGWGTSFLDFDNDGWKDILVANGHVYPQVDNFQWGTSFAQQLLLFKNGKTDVKTKQTRFERIAAAPNSGLAMAIPARGLAIGDLDGDGRQDAVINNIDTAPTILRNVSDNKNHWLRLKLVGDPAKKTPKDAVGSRVFVTIGGVRQRFDATSGGGCASQNDQSIAIGLGVASKIDKLEIRWAGGAVETIVIPKVDRALIIKEGKGIVTK
ncbi:MAG: CRTAC1 family protein [Pyrinomonadaceae bacterium]|nr:CRTAC1 family protein [Pyrinomonadaceae bacterium]